MNPLIDLCNYSPDCVTVPFVYSFFVAMVE